MSLLPVQVYFEEYLADLQWNHNLSESHATVESALECDWNIAESPFVSGRSVNSFRPNSAAVQSIVLEVFA